MSFKIKKAAVLGAGVMGATIAAHLTNAGIECYLLDIIPFELTDDDKKKGLTEKSPAWRNRFAANGLAGVTKSKPASFFTKKNASMVKIGNFEDNLKWLADVDWVMRGCRGEPQNQAGTFCQSGKSHQTDLYRYDEYLRYSH